MFRRVPRPHVATPAIIILLIAAGCDPDRLPTTPVASPQTSAMVHPASTGGLHAYVTNLGSDELSVIRVADNVVVATIALTDRPQHVAITPDGRFAYVAHNVTSGTSTVNMSVIRTATNSVVATLPRPTGQVFNTTAITPDGTHAYVTNASYDAANPDRHVQVLRLQDNSVVATIDRGPHRMGEVSSDGSFAYLTGCFPCSQVDDGFVTVVRTSDNVIVASIPISPNPNRIALTPDASRAYVSHNSSDLITVVRTSDNTVETTFDITESLGLGVSPDGQHLYVTGGPFAPTPGSVTVLRTSDHGVHAVFEVGARPQHVALTPDGSHAWVTNQISGTVSVVRTSDYATVATIAVGSDPIFVAFAMVKSPQDEIAELHDAIDDLEASDRLNSGRARALRNHLANALRMLERGQIAPAIAQLEAFIAQVEQFVLEGVLTEAEAAPLIIAAENALAGVTGE